MAGDGKTDDWAGIQALLDAHRCVFLPRGVYLVSRTLQVMPGGALIGLAKHLTRVVAADGGLGQARHPSPGSPTVRPVVEMLPGRSSVARGSTLAFISMTTWNNHSNTRALSWYADGGTYRQVHVSAQARRLCPAPTNPLQANRANRCGSLPGPGCSDSVEINHALQLVSGANTSLNAYTYFLEDCCHNHSTSVSHAGLVRATARVQQPHSPPLQWPESRATGQVSLQAHKASRWRRTEPHTGALTPLQGQSTATSRSRGFGLPTSII